MRNAFSFTFADGWKNKAFFQKNKADFFQVTIWRYV